MAPVPRLVGTLVGLGGLAGRAAGARTRAATGASWPFAEDALGRPATDTTEGHRPMTTISHTDRFSRLPDEQTLDATVAALGEHGFGVDVVDDLDAARATVLALIPEGSTVMTNTSVTLDEAGISEAINHGGGFASARNQMAELDFATQLQEMKAIAGQPDYALGSVHAITAEGTLVIASASGSQLASYVW